MTQHVVIRREEYVAGTADKPEVRVFTQTHASRRPTPWGRVAIGELVWMKWSGGPIVARGVIEGFRQIENCTPNILRNSVGGTELYDLEEYWKTRPPVFFGLAVFVGSQQWVVPPIFPSAKSYGESWIVLSSPEHEAAWLTDRGERVPALSASSRLSGRRRSLRPSTRFEVLRRDSFTCRYCGRKSPLVRLQIDHIIPWSKGGSDEPTNLVVACVDCNLGKGATPVDLVVDA